MQTLYIGIVLILFNADGEGLNNSKSTVVIAALWPQIPKKNYSDSFTDYQNQHFLKFCLERAADIACGEWRG